MKRPLLVLGAGGHARVLIDALLASGRIIAGIVDHDPHLVGTSLLGVPVIGGDEVVDQFPPHEILLVNGIGSVRTPDVRQDVYQRMKEAGYSFATVLHPSAVIAPDVELGEGAQVMAGAIVQTGTRIGYNSIVNTRASVDHDCRIGDHTHVAPGVTVSGGVTVGAMSHIGTAATIIQGVTIGAKAIVGAGALVLSDVPSQVTVVGIPAKVK